MTMKKALCFFFVMTLVFAASTSAFASNNTDAEMNSNVKVEGPIDPEIYQMVENYQAGTFKERNESKTLKPEALFNSFGLGVEQIKQGSDIFVEYIYDIKQMEPETYEATRVALVSLEQETQGSYRSVVIFCRIVYQEKSFSGNPWSYIMLTKVKGGVVQNNGDIWCETLRMRYSVHGIAYDANGNWKGYQGASTQYGTAHVYAPQVGTTYYIDGPCDYYYDMGVPSSAVAGFVQGGISYRLSTELYDLEVPCGISGV